MFRYVLATVGSATSYLVSHHHPESCQDLIIHNAPITNTRFNEKTSTAATPPTDPIDEILRHRNLYDVLGTTPSLADDPTTLKRAYLAQSRRCHPDKFPDNPKSTIAFQMVARAYNILSDQPSRQAYDSDPTAYPPDDFTSNPSSSSAAAAHDTFDGVLQMLAQDFLSGDFDLIRAVLRTLKEVNPSMNMEEETIESVINGFKKLREVVLGTRTYVRVMRIELLHLYDIQYSLRRLPYLAISARLRLSIRFTRVALSLPMAIDRAIEAEDSERNRKRAEHAAETGDVDPNAQVGKKRSSILGPKVGGVVNWLVVALEKSESVL